MLIDLAFIAGGVVLLYFGAEYLVRGSANTAVILGANPIIVGLTVVAFGTSAPELIACIMAASRGAPDMATGNVVGSNIANIGLVLAIGAIIYPMAIQKRLLRRDLPIMLLFAAALIGLSWDGQISRLDGAILTSMIVAATGYFVYSALRQKEDAAGVEEEMGELLEKEGKLSYELLITAIGMVGVAIGAYLLVEGASSIARSLGVSDLVIGITVVAIGTSLPELATIAVAAMKRHSDIAIGAIVGSNIYNIGLIMGMTALISPLPVSHAIVTHEMAIMAAFSLFLLPVALRPAMGRIPGAILLVSYVGFIYSAV